MKKTVLFIFLTFLIYGCATKKSTKGEIYISNDKLYGDLVDGKPEKDTLIEISNKKGIVTGKGRVALNKTEPTTLKVGFWKEYSDDGLLFAEGNYKLSSYINCCMGGACRTFYFYRFGEWKYFNKKGELIYTLEFVPQELRINTNCEGGDTLIFGLIKNIPLNIRNKITADKIYELQKISYSDIYHKETLIPLNGKVFVEIEMVE